MLIILSLDKEGTSSKQSAYVPDDIEERLAKMESNIYKIMSGMLNPQPTKKNKQRVDEKQISLWSDDIVDFGKIEKPADYSKADFEDFAKPISEQETIDDETALTSDEVAETETYDNSVEEKPEEIAHEDLFDDEFLEDEETEESTYELEEETTQDIANEDVKENVDEEPAEEENLFNQEAFLSDQDNKEDIKEVKDEYIPLFEENLEDYYTSSEESATSEETSSDDVNLFNEEKTEVTEEIIEETPVEETVDDEELERERLEKEKASELERIELERKAQEDRLFAEKRERERALEREKALQEAEQKREEAEKIEAARASGGPDLDEYERYDVKVLERIFSDERNPEYYGEKGRIERVWKELLRLAPLEKRGVAEILAEGRVSDVGNHEFIILFNNAAICNQVMNRRFKKISLKLLYDILGTDYNYFAITQEVYLEKRSEYASQYAVGTKYPILSPIVDPNLRVVIEEDDADSESMIRKTMNVFGDKLNVK